MERSVQPAIEDYAIIGDSRAGALISRDASIGWLCLPESLGPSIFGEILDRRTGGLFVIRPRDASSVERRYVDNTPVLETTFITAHGTARLIDVIPVLNGVGTNEPMREIHRILEGVSGEVDLDIRLDPSTGIRAYQAAPGGSRPFRLVLQLVERASDLSQRYRAGAGEPSGDDVGAQIERPAIFHRVSNIMELHVRTSDSQKGSTHRAH